MKLIRRITAFILLALSYAFLFFLLRIISDIVGVSLLDIPSYHQRMSVDTFFYFGGVSALLGLLSVTFSWLKGGSNLLDETTKRDAILRDAMTGRKNMEEEGGML